MGRITLKVAGIIIIFSLFIFIGIKVKSKIESSKWENNIMLTAFNETKEGKKRNYTKISSDGTKNNLANDINVYLENKKLDFKDSIIRTNNRYYFSVQDIKSIFNYEIKIYNSEIHFYKSNQDLNAREQQKDIVIDYKNDTYFVTDEKELRNSCIIYNNTIYLSMIDMTEIFNLKVKWNYENKELRFFNNKNKLIRADKVERRKRPALIRFEDVTAGVAYTNSDNLQKIRIVSDFMYSQRVPFHIAWVPRYKNPKEGIDNDLLKVDSMANADFIYTMDYMIDRDGVVGLHGYTHQHDDEESVIGTEFGEKAYSSVVQAEDRIKTAIDTARQLNIPFEFFESPHYRYTKQQQMVFENNFNYIFQAEIGVYNNRPVLSERNKKTVYVPAPLGYIQDTEIDSMISKIKNKPKGYLAAMFYHPVKEFDDIKLTKTSDSYPEYEYSENSMLHKMVRCLNEEGYTPIKINDIRLGR